MLQKHELGSKVVYLKDEKTYIVCTATLRNNIADTPQIVYNITNNDLTVNGPIVSHYDLDENVLCSVDDFKVKISEKMTNL